MANPDAKEECVLVSREPAILPMGHRWKLTMRSIGKKPEAAVDISVSMEDSWFCRDKSLPVLRVRPVERSSGAPARLFYRWFRKTIPSLPCTSIRVDGANMGKDFTRSYVEESCAPGVQTRNGLVV
jgi:hypothetical protein